ncbi:hypothetical protein G3N95_14870 [Paraburkholderia sp. Tr-20389]|uniref:hypothetical protein n=1 Tax=Paraburkholderia sp. Tr-20389 TaxID=2703903 RepID=UPI0019801EAF|nr:hypothetical protein [Paraburkholderia sp. Tr-20389]MBN3754232.1 hypothetical protein [Paraburkholderia sp. Tr-20389]
MSLIRSFNVRAEAATLSVRPCNPRVGTNHTYVLNGTLLRDVLIDGRWVTVHVSDPTESRSA